MGASYDADIAIDDVVVTPGFCPCKYKSATYHLQSYIVGQFLQIIFYPVNFKFSTTIKRNLLTYYSQFQSFGFSS